jgi:hypothetical protein
MEISESDFIFMLWLWRGRYKCALVASSLAATGGGYSFALSAKRTHRSRPARTFGSENRQKFSSLSSGFCETQLDERAVF